MKIPTEKNRDRESFSFANINLLGKCNVDCYFCLGKDLEAEIKGENQLRIHYSYWENFHNFIRKCHEENIKKIYITGQNTDSLLYPFLEELIYFLRYSKFLVGLRTNGYQALKKQYAIKLCNEEVGYSIHTLNPETNLKIMGRRDIPDWKKILPLADNTRVSIVIGRHNYGEFYQLVHFISQFPNVRYIQVRKISTDNRKEMFALDQLIFEKLFQDIRADYSYIGDIHKAQRYQMLGKEICFWRTVNTSVNSINYFTDGTLSTEYFIVEGWLRKNNKLPLAPE